MTGSSLRLPALPIPGLPPNSPGSYLASLGLLRLLARTWPTVRVAWHEEVLRLVDGPTDIGELVNALVAIAKSGTWSPYNRDWLDAQKRSTKEKSGAPLGQWQGSAKESSLELVAAHAVPTASISFNPLLGSGGNAGKRDFAKGWETATAELKRALEDDAPATPSMEVRPKKANATKAAAPDAKAELAAMLLGRQTTWLLEKLNAASWFSDANKLYNSGQAAFRDGRLSPWTMALACEGLPFLAGGASRRLGAHARAIGAFPFVTYAAAPSTSGEAGRDSGEFWAPLWNRPMTLPEVRALFARGRAEVRGREASTPGAFATAVVRRGADAGVAEFRRFVLSHTTSANTFEPRFEGAYRLDAASTAPESSSVREAPAALERALDLVNRLPRDRRKGRHWTFVGIRGPVEKAMLQLAQEPDDPAAACSLLDAVVVALDRIDRNRTFRERRVSWQPLPAEWLPALFGTNLPPVEARLALTLASAFPIERPFTLYRFGVEKRRGRFEHPPTPPQRWVWRPGQLARVVSDVLLRRTLDWESAADEAIAREGIPAAPADVSRWLDGSVDETLLARWISRLALFDWDFVPFEVRAALDRTPKEAVPIDGALALSGLLGPLFDLQPVRRQDGPVIRDLLDPETGARTPGAARTLARLLEAGKVDSAVRLAASRYAMANVALARTAVSWSVRDSDRLLASILFPIATREKTALIERWLRPERHKGESNHA